MRRRIRSVIAKADGTMLMIKEHVVHSTGLDGILNMNKPSGWTSHDVVAKLRSAQKGRRIGHAGTLDPAATGVLPVLIGRATRIAEYLLDWDKEYRAVLRLGETTDTLDATGTMLNRSATDHVTEAAIRAAFAQFHGEIDQLPPMYSAVKVAGVPLYKTARAGKTVEREARRVTVHELEILTIDGRDIMFRVRCSKGTYIRTLAADIGTALGVGAHLLSLERRRVGPLRVEEASTIDQAVEAIRAGRMNDRLLSMDQALAHLPSLTVSDVAGERACHGVPIPFRAVQWDPSSDGGVNLGRRVVRVKDHEGRLLALGSVSGYPSDPDGIVTIDKVLVETRQ